MSGKGLKGNDYLVSTNELCEIMGLSSRRIQQLVDEKAVVRASHGKYDLPATFKAYLEYEKEKVIADDPDLDKLREETLWTRARRKKTEAELGIITGKLHRAGDVESIMNAMMMSFRSQLLSFASRLAPKVQGKKDLVEIQELVKDEVEDLMNELKDYDPDVFYAESDDVITSDEPMDGERVE
ncbi:hypothetical protein GCM10007425_29410 [Lysinibacillus alkalisoli]|uniref:Terminase small subunit n=1 Tax=Lysinibacillus alkalisoli TaxID=1911548 RepID=A0A917LJ86_9BACI|nr:hypothetical protein [Lysinibacillus alkalisoli]GGG32869.1 hypothetical protein GCM10007425_29410 [Lysinibacillus alkalisoli]